MNAHLTERLRGARLTSSEESSSTTTLPAILNVDIRRYMHQQEELTTSTKSMSWQKLPEVPSNQEVARNESEDVSLPKNVVDQPYKKVEKYLRTHFLLLREDAISPLREAVDKYKGNPDMMDDKDTAIYEKVRIVGFVFSHTGIAARIQFSTRRANASILWAGSKRLLSGGIVALSPVGDNFSKKCVVAIVAARPTAGVQANPPEIDLFFFRSDDLEIDSRQEWIMVEARTGYFEAYRHTMKALQKLGNESFPLSKHICFLKKDITTPTYRQDNPVVDLSPATGIDSQTSYGRVDVTNIWPSPSQSSLDATQWSSLQQVLTKSLAIVQGPPGTGKTYVSTVALEILNRSSMPGDPPIIIAAQTNHALDQLLEHVSHFEPDYVRLGGRSTSMEVKKHALYEIRKKERINMIPGSLLGKATSQNHLQSKEMLETLKPLYQDPNRALSAEAFAKFKVITEQQARSIPAGSSRWINSSAEEVFPMDMWLSGALFPYPEDKEEQGFGFAAEEDEDLELEQLREQEAEHGVNDDEDAQDMLQGQWCSVNQKLGVSSPSDTEIADAIKSLEAQTDLWKIPERQRGPVYYVMMQRLKDAMLKQFREQASAYDRNLKDLKTGKWERDAVFLSRAKIIGLTTTGLSKYRPLIASLKPKIVLIEEAAEVLEAPIAVANMESVEHLILVGDHQQLQAHCSVAQLAVEFNLNKSMFERLVDNKMPYTTLLSQRRMHPDFRKLLTPIYPTLKDHPSVWGRPNRDWGMGELRNFFFDHEWYESRDSQMSTYNDQEAQFVAGFYRWLTVNGLAPGEVTLLTLYNGHRKRLLKAIREYPELKQVYNNVKTVDSYQGEENTVVLLCLARHNLENKIGFLENKNRVCVALSRAKEGFYIFGSTTVLARDELWMSVVTRMKAQGRVGRYLPVTCKQHGNRLRMETPEDWKQGLGGCKEKCLQTLSCGHVCALKCHPFSHDTVDCAVNCQKRLACGHICQQRCYQACSCDCEVFQNEMVQQRPRVTYGTSDVRFEGQRSSREDSRTAFSHPMTSNLPSQGQSFVDGRYLSGRYPHTETRLYLHDQESRLTSQGRTMEDGQSTTDSPGTTSRSSIPELFGEPLGRRQYASSPFTASRFTNAEQEKGRENWSGFANGGALFDDHQRSLASRDQAFHGNQTNHQDQGDRGQLVRNQRAMALKNGRQRFTEEYVPAAMRAAGQKNDVKGPGIMESSQGAHVEASGAVIGVLIDFD